MLMHEWLKYRQKQVKEADSGADVASEETATQTAQTGDGSAHAADASAERAARVRELMSALEEVGSEAVRQRLQTMVSRQGRLPLEVSQTAPRRQGGGVGETREQLIQRLLDPTLSLQDAATLLGVCTSTVRRYTNRGALRCFRTPGNQRRFRLSDLLSFMERSENGGI